MLGGSEERAALEELVELASGPPEVLRVAKRCVPREVRDPNMQFVGMVADADVDCVGRRKSRYPVPQVESANPGMPAAQKVHHARS